MAYFLSPIGNSQFVDANGDPIVDGTLSTFLAGTSTPQTTYTSNTGAVPQGAVMTLNSFGYPENGPVWMLGGVPLKFILKDSLGATIGQPFDNISGIGDVSTSGVIDAWQLFGGSPTYISATSFSLVGDQTSYFPPKTAVKSTNTGGSVYSTVQTAVYGAPNTTVTVVNSSGVLDSGLSAVYTSIIAAVNPPLPGINTGKLLGRATAGIGPEEEITVAGTLSLAAGVLTGASSAVSGIRQTVLSGPVDTSGFSAFGGSTGSTTVTASGTLIATAANGFTSSGNTDRIGSITNPSWTSLSTNGTMYLYLDIASNGTCTTGSTTLAPNYRWGGADIVTSGQFTFNIQEMSGKVGNGSVATQTYRVFVGEVTVSGAVVTAITWYALMGRYESAITATLPAAVTTTNFNHNIGCNPSAILNDPIAYGLCTTTEQGYAVGTVMRLFSYIGGNAITGQVTYKDTRNTAKMQSGNTSTGWVINNTAAGGQVAQTAANWSYFLVLNRGW